MLDRLETCSSSRLGGVISMEPDIELTKTRCPASNPDCRSQVFESRSSGYAYFNFRRRSRRETLR